uniref:Uncharacterized protein n=1 Tax=Plectus sambesii TaxID=2011161 RepID=A0A914WBL6_9BILA
MASLRVAATILAFVIGSASAQYDSLGKFRILVVHDNTTDSLTNQYIRHMNISLMYINSQYKDVKLDQDLTIDTVLITDESGASQETLCDALDMSGTSVSFIISIARATPVRRLVKTIAENGRIPTVQVLYTQWSLNMNDTNQTLSLPTIVDANATLPNYTNYLTFVPPTTVLLNVMYDVINSVNMSKEITVIYDDLYDPKETTWKTMLNRLPQKLSFLQMKTNDTEAKAQILQLRNQYPPIETLLIVAKTANVEMFTLQASTEIEEKVWKWFILTKDVTAFKCDDCQSVEAFWIRAMPDTSFTEIRKFNDYLVKQEIGIELEYKITGDNEMDVGFYMGLVRLAVDHYLAVNKSQYIMPTYGCFNQTWSDDNRTIALSELMTGRNASEYGEFIRDESKRGWYFQNVRSRIYKIDRVYAEPDAKYNKLVGNWTIIDKLVPLYGDLMVDVRMLNHYQVAILIQPPFIERFIDPIKGPSYRGYCIDLIDMIKEEVKFTYTLYEVPDGMAGTMNERGEWNGLIGELVDGTADIALAPLSVMAERENDVDFTVPYYDLVGTTILMKKPDMEYSLFKFMKVLEWPVWLCIVGAYFFTSFLLWIFDKFSPYSYSNNKDKYKDDPEKREFNLKECLWFCMTSLTPQGGGEAPKNISGRLVAATWWLFGFIIIASYTANLAAFLTVSRLEQPISSLDDLAKQYKIEYAPVKGSASETYFRRMAEIEEQFYNIWKQMSLNESMSAKERAKLAVWDYPVSDKFTNMWRYMEESKLPENSAEAIKRVLDSQDGFAYIGDATEIKYAALTDCNLQQVGTEFSRKPYAIAVQTGHALKDQISSAILKLLNQRKLESLKEKWWHKNPNKKECPDPEDESDGISIQNIGGVFIVILAGIVLSIITLTFEYFYYRNKPQKSEKTDQNGGVHHSGTVHRKSLRNGKLDNNHRQTELKERNHVSNGTAVNNYVTPQTEYNTAHNYAGGEYNSAFEF